MKKIFIKLYEFIKVNYKVIILDLFVLSLLLFVCLYNFPYYVYKPGGTINLSSRVYVNNKKADTSSYNLAYLSVGKGNIPNLIAAKIFKDWEIKKEEDVTYSNTDYNTTFKLDKIDYQKSINLATIVAYKKAGLEYNIINPKMVVYAVADDANTDLQVLDEIISVDGKTYETVDEISNYFMGIKDNEKVTIKVKNGNKEYDRYAYLHEDAGKKVIGIVIYKIFDLETNPNIKITQKSSEAGSSGGLMLALAIYDAITDTSLARNRKIVGTGTIAENGVVGPIGGVKYKLLGAKKAKADVFFIPDGNYEEAKKVYDEYNMKFDLVKVSTFDDAVNYLSK